MARYFVLCHKPLLAELLVMRNRKGGVSENHLISSTQEGRYGRATAYDQLTKPLHKLLQYL